MVQYEWLSPNFKVVSCKLHCDCHTNAATILSAIAKTTIAAVDLRTNLMSIFSTLTVSGSWP
jgi:hypothetical protein